MDETLVQELLRRLGTAVVERDRALERIRDLDGYREAIQNAWQRLPSDVRDSEQFGELASIIESWR